MNVKKILNVGDKFKTLDGEVTLLRKGKERLFLCEIRSDCEDAPTNREEWLTPNDIARMCKDYDGKVHCFL